MTKFLNISTDTTLGGVSPSDEIVSSQKALKTYIDNIGMGANTDLSNLTDTGANIGNWSSNVTNCITEIPQDIKLELNNGTLTLKAGSKIYVPNGSGIFNEETTDVDKSRVIFESDGQYMVFYSVSYGGSRLAYIKLSDAVSGSSDTSVSNTHVWYDTTNNQIKFYNSGSYIYTDLSLPITIVTVSNGAISNIDQVFNGFGYIGSTVFALPGVKALAPNGRNTDGTLNNTEVPVTSVRTYDASSRGTDVLILSNGWIWGWDKGSYFVDEYPTPQSDRWWLVYDSEKNEHYKSENGGAYTKVVEANVGNYMVSSGKVASLNPKQPFHAVDYSDYSNLVTTVNTKANDNAVVHLAGTETITGDKYFTQQIRRDGGFGSGATSLIEATDTNGKGMVVDQCFYANNAIVKRMAAYNATTQNWTWIDVWNYDNGGTYATAPASDGWGTILLTSAISKSQNGYVKLGNGIIIQWGLNGPQSANSSWNVTFPTPFTATPQSVQVGYTSIGNGYAPRCTNTTTTGFSVEVDAFHGSSNPQTYLRWIAIGY